MKQSPMFLIAFWRLKSREMAKMEVSESTEAIRRRIIIDAEKKAQELIEEAKDKAADIVESAGKRAGEMKKLELEQIKQHVKERSMQDVAERKVAHHRRLQSFKSEIIEDVFEKAKDELREYVKKPAYLQILKQLITESAVVLGGGELSITVREEDKKQVARNFRKLSKTIQERTGSKTNLVLDNDSLKVIGGVVVLAVDQRASIDNTFEARLDRIREDAEAELEAVLFK